MDLKINDNDGSFCVTDTSGEEYRVIMEQMMDDFALVCTNSGDTLVKGCWIFEGENEETVTASIMTLDPIFDAATVKGQLEELERQSRIQHAIDNGIAPNGAYA